MAAAKKSNVYTLTPKNQRLQSKKKPPVNRQPQTHKEMTRKIPEPDDDMVRLQNAIKDSGLDEDEIAKETGVSWYSIHNICIGLAKYPRNSTVEKILNACGVERQWVKICIKRGKSR